MADIVILPSVLGVRPGVTETAERLRAAGHRVEVLDVLDGRAFASYEPALAHARQVDSDAQMARAVELSRAVGGAFHAIGFSSGGGLALHLATQRPRDVRGVAVVGSALPMQYVGGGAWPPGVPVQEHVGEEDDFDDGPEIRAEFTADVEKSGVTPQFFTYAGAGHLFNDPTMTEEYDAGAAEQLYARLLDFVAA